MNRKTLTAPVLILSLLPCAGVAWADNVNLTYFNSVPLMDENMALLEDGCIVQLIYAGADGTIDIPNVYNGGTTGDDIIWQTVRIGDNVPAGTGSFIGNVQLEYNPGDQVYVRFFNAPTWDQVTYYGQTPLHTLSDFFGFEIWNITAGGLYLWTVYPFMIIPEPETWVTLISGLAFAALVFRRKKKEPEDKLAA